MQQPWEILIGDGPIVATAIHQGHDLRPEILERMFVDEATRLREEDPYTAEWTVVAGTRVIVHRSRFEVDMNRTPEKAVYIEPEDAWGIKVWKETPSDDVIERSRALHEGFRRDMHQLFTEMWKSYGHFIVLDIHSYNHRRDGAEAPAEDPEKNPEINLGTRDIDMERWGELVDVFRSRLREMEFNGNPLDVRDNVKFPGGPFSRWIHKEFPGKGLCLAIEFKKIFMDEWSGKPDPSAINQLVQALAYAVKPLPGMLLKL